MGIRELLDAGQDILGAVSDAVDTGDYSSLAWDIQDIVFGEAGDQRTSESQNGYYSGQDANRQQAYNDSRSRQAGSYGNTGSGQQNGSRAGNTSYQRQEVRPQRNFFRVNQPNMRKSAILHKLGLVGGVCFLAASVLSVAFFALAGTAGLRPSPMGILILAFFVIMAVLCLVVSRRGKKEQQLIEHFYAYARVIGTKEYFSIEEVASASGVEPDQVRKDMKELRDQGIVPYLTMDRNQSTVMLSERMAQEYEKAEQARVQREKAELLQRQQEERQREEEERAAREAQKSKSRRKEEKDTDSGDNAQESEIDALIREGNASIRTIREINDRIPDDYEMSNKLYRLENTMKGIFERVRKEPARAKDIRKLMNYYLPTTIKLLKAYAELYEQPSGGENVEDSKRQIEAAMDTINDAFENLLDDLFQDQAWDIASDINVMKTMMAQDGLVDDKPKQTVSG